MKTRIKFYNNAYFPQCKSWWCWHPVIVSLDLGFGKPIDKTHWWVHKINAQKAIDKFIQNGYRND